MNWYSRFMSIINLAVQTKRTSIIVRSNKKIEQLLPSLIKYGVIVLIKRKEHKMLFIHVNLIPKVKFFCFFSRKSPKFVRLKTLKRLKNHLSTYLISTSKKTIFKENFLTTSECIFKKTGGTIMCGITIFVSDFYRTVLIWL